MHFLSTSAAATGYSAAALRLNIEATVGTNEHQFCGEDKDAQPLEKGGFRQNGVSYTQPMDYEGILGLHSAQRSN